jgi:hypothetical protein
MTLRARVYAEAMRMLLPALLIAAEAAVAQPRVLTVDENTPRGREAAAGGQEVVSDRVTETRPLLHLRGLDTLDGTTQDIDLGAGETVTYRHLEITAETCRVPANDPEGDAWALLSIKDVREDAPRFAGWMFASSPALSALDHPRYDVWVLSCSNR